MLNTLIGWSIGQQLGGNFDTIRFEVSIGAGTASSPNKISRTVAESIRGSEQQKRLTGGENFISTGIYTFCEPGKVAVDILPNNNSNNKISVVIFNKQRLIDLRIPKLFETDVTIDFYNSENQANDVTIAFEGFWITESQTPVFTDRANSVFRILNNIDVQTLATVNLIALLGRKIDITNSLLINPKSYTIEQAAIESPPLVSISPAEERAKLTRICGTGAKQKEEDEGDEE